MKPDLKSLKSLNTHLNALKSGQIPSISLKSLKNLESLKSIPKFLKPLTSLKSGVQAPKELASRLELIWVHLVYGKRGANFISIVERTHLFRSSLVGLICNHGIRRRGIICSCLAGFLPTFGPAFIHVYGSTRDYSLIDEHSALNTGLGEGVSYRARLLVGVRTEMTDCLETAPSAVEVEPAYPITEVTLSFGVLLFTRRA